MISRQMIAQMPKAELHVHIEGTLEAELCFELARRNGVKLTYGSIKDLQDAYRFNNLQEFLDIYNQGAEVLIEEQDFYDLAWAYLAKAKAQNVLHAEIFSDPQLHTLRGIEVETVLNGLTAAMAKAETELALTSRLIFCIQRHVDLDNAMDTVVVAEHCRDRYAPYLIGIGLDSSERGFPPSNFIDVFDRARAAGFIPVAHAGEEGPAEYVTDALDNLKIQRLDHGNRSLEDDELVKRLVREEIPLTLCPLSNVKLRIVDQMKNHPLRKMLEKGLKATVNSDDPAYFGGYINENFYAAAEALELTEAHLYELARNSFEASFISESQKRSHIAKLDDFAAATGWRISS